MGSLSEQETMINKLATCLKKCVRLLYGIVVITVILIPQLKAATHAAPASTEVGGPIISDTTWTLANSPYIVVANILVFPNVTLTIEPGVTVKLNGDKVLQVDGELIARGAENNYINFTVNDVNPSYWGNIYFTDSSIDASFDSQGNYTGGSILQNCSVFGGGSGGSTINGAIQTNNASPFINRCTVNNSLTYGIYSIGSATVPILLKGNIVRFNSNGGIYGLYNIVENNLVDSNYGRGIYAEHSTILNNDIWGNSAGNFYDGGGIWARDCEITGNTIEQNSAENGGGIYGWDCTIEDNTVVYNTAAIGGGIYGENATITGNTVRNNEASNIGGGINVGGINADNSIVSNNVVIGNQAGKGGGIMGGNQSGPCSITDNYVSGNSAESTWYSNEGQGGGVYSQGCTLTGNTIISNSASHQGSGLYIDGESPDDISYNNIIGNSSSGSEYIVGGVAIDETVRFAEIITPKLHFNNIYSNFPFDVVVLAREDISAENNYWGTTNSVDILGKVFDWYDDTERGRLLYIPYLQDPDPSAPIPPPTNLQANFTDNSVTLTWDPIPSTATGFGYKIHYNQNSPGPPFSGTGLSQGNSPIVVGNATTYTLSGLSTNDIYYIAVTAYDTLGHESWYSNQVNNEKPIALLKAYIPLVVK